MALNFFDDSLLNAVLISLIIIILWFTYADFKTSKKLPPGPKGLPYFGYMPFLGKKPHITLTELRKKYGDILMLHIYKERIIIVSSYKLIKEVLFSPIFEERPEGFRQAVTFGPETGIFGGYGASRIEFHRFAVKSLKNFGMGKSSLEPTIQDEIQYMIEEIEKQLGQPTDLHPILTTSISNNIHSILFGKRMNYNDHDLQQLLKVSKDFIKSVGIDQWSNHLPQFLVKALGIQNPSYYANVIHQKIIEKIDKYDKSEFSTNNPDNFINAWRAQREKSNEKQELYNETRLAEVVSEFFVAGSDTTSVTLEWAILYLIKHPEKQKKIQTEIDTVIGRTRTPTMSDQKLMPYTEATILEVTRITSLVPLSDPHCASQDTSLSGYNIPTNTTIWTNLYALHHDPEIFPEPDNFLPERFLTKDNKVENAKEVIPFGIGRRQCPGEAFSRMSIFLYLTSLLQHFHFSKLEDIKLDSRYCMVLDPPRQKINVSLRN